MAKILKELKNKKFDLILIFTLSVFIIWPLFLPGYFSHHDDLQVMRIFEMRQCFIDFQIPCRWVPDMGYGNGFPLFNYYGVFPYYLGAILSFIFGFVLAAKLLFLITLLFGGVGMYFLSKELFGRNAGLVSAILYQFAPYRALDSYVRGAISESFALTIIPFVFYFLLKLSRTKSVKYFLASVLAFGAFLTSHNIMTIYFLPIIISWIIWLGLTNKTRVISLLLAFLLGFGLAAFFIVPAFVEKDLVQTDNLIRLDLNFRAHFVTVSQLFTSYFWGYGASTPGNNDTISFQIGWPLWWVALGSLVLILISFFNRRNLKSNGKKNSFIAEFVLAVIFLVSIFMTHNKSAFVWESLKIIQYSQFPWRFLSIVVFSGSLLGGLFIIFLPNKYRLYVSVGIIFLAIILNWAFFRPDKFYFDVNDQKKLSRVLWDEQRKAAILDYLPITAVEPKEAAPANPFTTRGVAKISNFINRSNSWSYQAEVAQEATIESPIFYFPNWQVFVNDSIYPLSHKNYLGRVEVTLAPGSYNVSGRFTNTPIRTLANFTTLICVGVLLIVLLYGKVRKNYL